MRIASRQPIWNESGHGTVIEVEMTPTTGLKFQLAYHVTGGSPVAIAWGDGTRTEHPYQEGDVLAAHRYPLYGRYKVTVEGIRSVGLRFLDGGEPHPYDAAVISVVDYSGQIVASHSAAFKEAVNLVRYICPNCAWQGQRDFAFCPKLKEVEIGENKICYDGTYQFCTSLEKYTTKSTGICWSYVWQGCERLRELHLGAVSQFATDDFDQCPNLTDIWIDNRTVEQIKQVADEGNIVSGYGAKFPWNANSNCRFHGTNGIVLGNGTIIHN